MESVSKAVVGSNEVHRKHAPPSPLTPMVCLAFPRRIRLSPPIGITARPKASLSHRKCCITSPTLMASRLGSGAPENKVPSRYLPLNTLALSTACINSYQIQGGPTTARPQGWRRKRIGSGPPRTRDEELWENSGLLHLPDGCTRVGPSL